MKSKEKIQDNIKERILPVPIEDEMRNSYLDYAMSVIIGRALPDIRDGLKPVHRRILYAMFERAWTHDKPFVKSAKIVGEVIGNYHPHGDMAVYDTLVRMAQDFTMRVPLIDGQGNFGSIDGDNPAAYRYTEARLASIAEQLLIDLKKETVDFTPNFDKTREEPVVLPSAFPNLLVNGSDGIAVGMATNVPPHNLCEVIDGVIKLIDNSNLKPSNLMEYIPGPDFPTGGIIYGIDGIKEAYTTGRGRIILRARATIETGKNDKKNIIITEIPYQVNKSSLLESIAALVRDKKIEGVSALRDESDREGMRIVIELKKDAPGQIILNQLFKHTQLQITFGIIMLALVDNTPKILNLKEILQHYINHRKEVVIRRTKFDLKKSEERAHILAGLKIALDKIDAVISTIRASKTVETAKNNLMSKFKLTEIQAVAILEMRLQRLTGLEREKIEQEYKDLLKQIKELKSILASEKRIFEVIKKELLDIKAKFGDKRRTEIIKEASEAELTIEDVIADEDMAITISKDGFIKRMPVTVYRRQRRGGKGVTGANIKQEDAIKHLIIASTHNYILFFTNKGKVFWLKVHEIPQESRLSRGRAISGLINLAQGEEITASASIKEFVASKSLVMVTKKGTVKRICVSEFENAKKKGIFAINLEKDDELKEVKVSENDCNVFIATKLGKALRMDIKKIREMGRGAKGVRGLKLSAADEIIGMDLVMPKTKLLVITQKGFGKRTEYRNFPAKGRGGKGIFYIKINDRIGNAVAIHSVFDDDEIMITTQKGMIIRINVSDIRVQSRNSQGVKVVECESDDMVMDVGVIRAEEDGKENNKV